MITQRWLGNVYASNQFRVHKMKQFGLNIGTPLAYFPTFNEDQTSNTATSMIKRAFIELCLISLHLCANNLCMNQIFVMIYTCPFWWASLNIII